MPEHKLIMLKDVSLAIRYMCGISYNNFHNITYLRLLRWLIFILKQYIFFRLNVFENAGT